MAGSRNHATLCCSRAHLGSFRCGGLVSGFRCFRTRTLCPPRCSSVPLRCLCCFYSLRPSSAAVLSSQGFWISGSQHARSERIRTLNTGCPSPCSGLAPALTAVQLGDSFGVVASRSHLAWSCLSYLSPPHIQTVGVNGQRATDTVEYQRTGTPKRRGPIFPVHIYTSG